MIGHFRISVRRHYTDREVSMHLEHPIDLAIVAMLLWLFDPLHVGAHITTWFEVENLRCWKYAFVYVLIEVYFQVAQIDCKTISWSHSVDQLLPQQLGCFFLGLSTSLYFHNFFMELDQQRFILKEHFCISIQILYESVFT